MKDGRIRIVIADDQRSVTAAFSAILGTDPRMRVVAIAADGYETLQAVRKHAPDVLLTDIRMPGIDGLELARNLKEDPRTKVVVVTTFGLDAYVRRALANGAHGFILKRSRPALLIEAVLAAARGDALISPELTLRLLQRTTPDPATPPPTSAIDVLTQRERDIARGVALAQTNVEIGRELYISAGTVKTHIANIQAKLGVPNRVGIAVLAWEAGLAASQLET